MTALEVYDAVAIELNKVNSPTYTVEQFNYFFYKTLLGFSNERYNFYAVNQQLSDDLRVLLDSVTYPTDMVARDIVGEFEPPYYERIEVSDVDNFVIGGGIRFQGNPQMYTVASKGGSYITLEGTRPTLSAGTTIYVNNFRALDEEWGGSVLKFNLQKSNYFHVLGCVVTWRSADSSKKRSYPAKHLTVDMKINISTNAYLKPSFRQPYYMLKDNVGNLVLNRNNTPLVEVYLGPPITGVVLDSVRVEYLKLPDVVSLTEADVYTSVSDGSTVLQFPDYLKDEFVKRLTTNFLENTGNPRVNTQVQINQDIPKVPLEFSQQRK